MASAPAAGTTSAPPPGGARSAGRCRRANRAMFRSARERRGSRCSSGMIPAGAPPPVHPRVGGAVRERTRGRLGVCLAAREQQPNKGRGLASRAAVPAGPRHPAGALSKTGCRAMDAYLLVKCGHCGAANTVGTCGVCRRHFVITRDRLTTGERSSDDQPVEPPPAEVVQPCDFCRAQQLKLGPMVSLPAGLRQRTCPACKTEFLSQHHL